MAQADWITLLIRNHRSEVVFRQRHTFRGDDALEGPRPRFGTHPCFRVDFRGANGRREKYGHKVEIVETGSLAVGAFKALMGQNRLFDIILCAYGKPLLLRS